MRTREDAGGRADAPAEDAVAARGRTGRAEVVGDAIARARAAQSEWGSMPLAGRLPTLRRYRELLGARRERIVEAIREDTSKPRTEALAEVFAGVELFRYYERVAPRVLRTEAVDTAWMVGTRAFVTHEPWGVVGVITPWNYPFVLAQDAITPAIWAGNAVVLKPSEFTPTASRCILDLMEEAGFPRDLLVLLEGDGLMGAELVRGGVDRVVFTGGSATGRKVMAAAAAGPTPVTLELGGKDAAIVLSDADLDRAADALVFGAFFNAGQTCISTERVIVERSVHDAFLERVLARLGRLRNGVGPDADVGPIVTDAQVEAIERQLEDARARGVKEHLAPDARDAGDRFVTPRVLTEVDLDADLWTSETFGPLLPVVAVEDEEEAISLANDTEFGLYGSVWTENLERGMRVASRLRTGGVSINDTLSHYAIAGLPMGGVGASGFGVRRGVEGLREMTRPRSTFIYRSGPRRAPVWFPYGARTENAMEALLVLRSKGWLRGAAEAWRVFRGAGPAGGGEA